MPRKHRCVPAHHLGGKTFELQTHIQGMALSREAMGMECLPLGVDPDRPEGTYALQLEKPSERAVALQLINLNRSRGGGLMKDVRQNGLALPSGVPDGWKSNLPCTGILEFNFVKYLDSKSHTVLDSKKVAALSEELHKPYTSDATKISSIMSLAPYTMLYASQVTRLLQAFETGDALVQVACVLFTRCVDLEDGAEAINAAMPPRDGQCFREELGHVVAFRGSNPTGHYEMALNNPHQRMLAMRLKDEAVREGTAVTWKNVLCAPGPPASTDCFEQWVNSLKMVHPCRRSLSIPVNDARDCADMNGQRRRNDFPAAQDLLRIGQAAFLPMATSPLTMSHLYNHLQQLKLQVTTSW